MSKATKRKHVAREVLDDYVLPEGNQQVVKVTSSKGNNLHEIETCTGERYLASMPTKYRKNVWIKRGDFVLVEPIGEGDKVKAEIVFVLYKDQIKYIKDEGKWPKEFETKPKEKCEATIPDDMLPPSSDSDEEFYDDSVLNVNRVQVNYVESEEDSDELEDPHVVNGGTH